MDNAITPYTGNVPAEVSAGNWGAIESLETTDLLVPKIYHQQALSKFAADGLARPGDFCDSITGEILATKETELEVIIFGMFKTMLVHKHDVFSNSWKLDRIVQIVPENAKEWATRDREEEIGGDKYRNSLYYNLYCLVPDKIKDLPYIMSLGSTKTKVAKKLNTFFAKLAEMKRPSASMVFKFKTTIEKNDKGQWFGLEVSTGRNATEEELLRAYAWHQKSKDQRFVAAEEESLAQEGDIDVNL